MKSTALPADARVKWSCRAMQATVIDVMRFRYLVFAAGLPLIVGAGVQPPAPGAREIMATMVDPSANFIWQSVAIIVTPDGVEEKSPRNDREWGELREAATLLADGGRLLRKDHRREGDRDWMKWSQAIVDAADTTLKAVDAKNADLVLEVGEEIYNTCVGCHGGYWRMSPRR